MKLASLVRSVCSRQGHPQPWRTGSLIARHCHSDCQQPRHFSSTISSVVQIFTVSRTTDFLHPWATPISQESTGSGFIISGRRIVTNAHVVTSATFVEVKKLNSGTRYKAKVRAFGHECDLAILIIESKKFWKEMEPLELLGILPNLSQAVCIVGYPQGGEGICITSGIVSRIDTNVYSHSRSNLRLPTLQVDAAINPGNSGGPVFMGNKVIGVAFQKAIDGENIGYVIPSPVVELFLASIVGGGETGFCSLGISTQSMDNHMMRDYFQMTKKMTGVLVTGINEFSQVGEYLEEDDVILKVDGIPIEDDGKVLFDKRLWIHLDGFIALKKPKERVSLKVLRNGKSKDIDMEALSTDTWYTTDYLPPSYYIFAGFVFTEPIYGGVKISQVLEGNINRGYTSFGELEVNHVNGQIVNSLKELCEVIAASTEYVRIDLEDNLVAMVKLSGLKKSDRSLLDSHKVMYGMSEDLEEAFPCLLEEELSD